MRLVASVCMSVCLSVTLTFESLDLESSFILSMQIPLYKLQVKFVYQGHRVKKAKTRRTDRLSVHHHLHLPDDVFNVSKYT